MKQAASLKNVEIDTLLPGIKINTGPDDFAPIEAMQLARFNGQQYELFGQVISTER
jgi:branched-chain amino acid transport system substrate-binding protein